MCNANCTSKINHTRTFLTEISPRYHVWIHRSANFEEFGKRTPKKNEGKIIIEIMKEIDVISLAMLVMVVYSTKVYFESDSCVFVLLAC